MCLSYGAKTFVFAPYKRLILAHRVVTRKRCSPRDHVFISRLSSLRKRQSVWLAISVCHTTSGTGPVATRRLVPPAIVRASFNSFTVFAFLRLARLAWGSALMSPGGQFLT